MGVQILFIMFIFIVALFVFGVNKQTTDYLNLIFTNKQLPELKVFKVGTHQLARIKLYGLKQTDNEKIDRENYYYSLVARIINAKLTYWYNKEEGAIDVIKPDLRLNEHREDFLDIIATFTNFDLRKFVFNGDDKQKLFKVDSPIINAMKEHADFIIDEIFKDMCDDMMENGVFEDIELE